MPDQPHASHAWNQTITALSVWHLSMPVTARRDHGIGAVEGAVDIMVLRLGAEDGTGGYGEGLPWVVFTGSAEPSFAALDRYIRPLVLGRQVGEHAAIMAEAARVVSYCTEAKVALDTALYDVCARLVGVPVWALLGGLARPTIPLFCSIADPDFDKDLRLMARLPADRVRIIKLKAGFKGHAFDMMRLEQLRADFPGFAIRVDYNQGLSPDDAMARVLDVATFKPDFIEQPVAASQRMLMARICARLDVPLLADESIFGPEDLAAHVDIADGVSIKIMKSGGLSCAQTVARLARAHGLSAYGGDMFETGLTHLAGIHMIAATPEITLGCEFYQAKYFLAQDLLTTPFPLANGQVVVPQGAGLGADVDVERLTAHAVTQRDYVL